MPLRVGEDGRAEASWREAALRHGFLPTPVGERLIVTGPSISAVPESGKVTPEERKRSRTYGSCDVSVAIADAAADNCYFLEPC